MMRVSIRVGLVAAVLGTPNGGHAQGALVQASELATLTQRIAGTMLSIRYYRPSVRGRAPIFGGQVPWGEVWTAGANDVTRFTVSRPVRLNGYAVAAGTYGVWIEVKRDSSWIFHLHPDTLRGHLPAPPLSEMLVSIPVSPRAADFRETLTWDVQHIRATGAQLQLRWDRTLVSLDVAVERVVRTEVASEVGHAYAGDWLARWVPRDTSAHPEPFPVRIWYDDSTHQLLARQAYPTPDDSLTYVLVPRGEGLFITGYLVGNELAEADSSFVMEFEFEGGRPVRWVERDWLDRLVARGERAPSAPRPSRD